MRLALLMGRTLRELEESMGSDEWEGAWLPFISEYDLPDEFFSAGQVCSVLARVFGNDAEPADFVPFFRQPKKAKTPDEIRAKFRAMRETLDATRRAR